MAHVLENEFLAKAEEILDVIARSPRCKQMVKGFMAEYHLEKILNDLKAQRALVAVERLDADGLPDFRVSSEVGEYLVECKMVMSARPYANGDFRVDFQRTRNSPADPLSRYYKKGDFDIVAACLYNQTAKWEFRFIGTRDLPVDEKVGKNCLKKALRYPGGLPWRESLIPLVSSRAAAVAPVGIHVRRRTG